MIKPKPWGGLEASVNQYIYAQEWEFARNWMTNHPEYDWSEVEAKLDAAMLLAGMMCNVQLEVPSIEVRSE